MNARLRGVSFGTLLATCGRLVISPMSLWRAFALAGAAGLALSAVTAIAWFGLVNQQRAIDLEMAQVQVTTARTATRSADLPSTETPTNFPPTQLATIDVRPALTDIHRLVSHRGMVLDAVQVQPRAPTAEVLGRSDLTLSLRGSYATIKQLCADMLSRYPNMTLAHLTLRKAATPPDLDATIVLMLWGAPAALGSSDSAPLPSR